MNFLHLKYFLLVAEELNITRAAERLYISQQSLSNHIQRLEQYYGTKLFYRKPPCPSPARGSSCCPLPRWWGRRSGI